MDVTPLQIVLNNNNNMIVASVFFHNIHMFKTILLYVKG